MCSLPGLTQQPDRNNWRKYNLISTLCLSNTSHPRPLPWPPAALPFSPQDAQGLTQPGVVHSLEDQIQHKLALLREHCSAPGRPPLVLLGHSIGGWVVGGGVAGCHMLPATAAGQQQKVLHSLGKCWIPCISWIFFVKRMM